MDCKEMENYLKKKSPISKMGRPAIGILGSYPAQISQLILKLRTQHPGWGAQSIKLELELEYGYAAGALPSIGSINRYLKVKGLMKIKEPEGQSPNVTVEVTHPPHYLWEMDAQGAVKVNLIGYHAFINAKDSRSKKYCMAFPVSVKSATTQPSTIHYKWALRLAFIESGLPRIIQVDKDSVFIENASSSPFPSRLQLWLMALGVQLSFIQVPPPKKQAMVERAHQTMERQTIQGQSYEDWQSFFTYANKRRQRLNEKFPSRSLNNQAPLQAFPKAHHSGLIYSIEEEYALLNLKQVYQYLTQCKWYRKVSSNKMISLGSQRYYLKLAKPLTIVQITCCNLTNLLVFRDDKEHIITKAPFKGLDKEDLMEASSKELVTIYQRLLNDKNCPI